MEMLMLIPRWCNNKLSDGDCDGNGGGARDHCGHARGDGEATVTRMMLMETSILTLDIKYKIETSMVSMLRPAWSQC